MINASRRDSQSDRRARKTVHDSSRSQLPIHATRCPTRKLPHVTRSQNIERDPIVLFKTVEGSKVFGDKDFDKVEKEAVEAVAKALNLPMRARSLRK